MGLGGPRGGRRVGLWVLVTLSGNDCGIDCGIDCEVSIPGLKGRPECVDIDQGRGGGFCGTTVQQRSHRGHQMREHGAER